MDANDLQQLSMGSILFRIVISLFLVIGLLYLFLLFLQKRNEFRLEQKSWIKVHDSFSIGVNRVVYLMEIMSKVYVVAMSENSIRLLSEIDVNSEEWEALKDEMILNQATVFPMFKGIFGRKRLNNDFQSELSRQIQRGRRLSLRVKGDQSDEKK